MKKGILHITVGVTFVVFQLLSIIGHLKFDTFPTYFVNVTNFESLIYELCYFLGANWLGVIGIILIIIGVNRNKEKWSIKDRLKIESEAKSEGLTIRQYIHKNLPDECEETCEFYRGKPKELKKYLGDLVSEDKISTDAYYYLMEEYN